MTYRSALILSAAMLVLSQHADAQHARHRPSAVADAPMSSSGSEERYAGLSSAEVTDLRAGRGMGLALPAELNGYPGPVHVLELTDALHLSPAQRETMLRLVAAMRAEVIPLGEQLIAGERVLDEVFVSGSASFASVNAAVAAAADARCALRAAHLRVHLEARDALTDVQRTAYARLRGYTPG